MDTMSKLVVILLFGCGRRDRCPRGGWRPVRAERSLASGPAVAGPVPGSRLVGDPHLRLRHHNAPKSRDKVINHTFKVILNSV